MQPPVNLLAVLVAAFVSMVLGFIWYGPLFGKMWSQMMGWSDKDMEKMKAGMGMKMQMNYLITFVGSLVMSFVLSHTWVFASTYMNVSGPASGASTGFWMWLGFVAPVTVGSVLWDGKPWKLWILNNGYFLISLILMGVILAVWQ